MIGSGAIGGPIIDALVDEEVPGCVLARILTLDPLPERVAGARASDVEELIAASDLVVEAAGHAPLASLGPPVVEAGVDLLVMSVGALVDDALLQRLSRPDGGRLLISTGAVGGLDTLLAAMLVAPLDSVALTSRKPAEVLVRPWMSPELKAALADSDGEVEAFSGPAREAVKLFPESANIAATLSLATVGFDRLRVRIVGTRDLSLVDHHVAAEGKSGSYDFRFRNRPAESNPRTSAIAPFSVIRALRRLNARTVIGV
ncbi:MAG: aspartate dehydrogenase domain-containing protein [Actinomycetota bacterium]